VTKSPNHAVHLTRCVWRVFSPLLLAIVLSVSWASQGAADVLDRVSEDLVISIDELGPRPTNIEMKVRQGIIFFYNATVDAPLTMELDFGENALTCFSSSTANLAFRDAKVLASTSPIPPGGFATTCFPALGRYTYTIFGLDRFPNGLKGQIEVTY
jgi:hypothetical protein